MARKDPPFALEQVVPGTFALQGVLGGMLGGFIYVWMMNFWSKEPDFNEALSIVPLAMFVGAIAGAIKATLLWTIHNASDLRMGVGMRVALMVNGIGAIAIFLIRFAEMGVTHDFPAGIVSAMLSALPITLLVGSRVKPWELFTFGSIALKQSREGSKSVMATIATLPLRFLSLFVLAVWILKIACERKFDADVMSAASMLVAPAVYPALSAYVTFRSPRKWHLLILGTAMNMPYGLISTAAFANTANTSWISQLPESVNFLCLGFTLAWALFLITRLTVKTSEPMIPATGLGKPLMQAKRF